MKKTPKNASKPTTKSPSVGTVWQQKGLNPHLIARIRRVTEGNIEGGQGKQTYNVDTTQPFVDGLFEDADFTIESQYSTPFEASNPESRLPNLMGLIQSKQASAALYSFFIQTNESEGVVGAVIEGMEAAANAAGITDTAKSALSGAESALRGLGGRSNFTKLNSRQIYTSSNSVRITGSLVFHAWADAKAEVEDAIELLQSWASPIELSDQSLFVSTLESGISKGLFPSLIPPLVQLRYGGKTYNPMVIESVSAPITAPMNKQGNRILVRVQITLLSLMAWDSNDILKMRR